MGCIVMASQKKPHDIVAVTVFTILGHLCGVTVTVTVTVLDIFVDAEQ